MTEPFCWGALIEKFYIPCSGGGFGVAVSTAACQAMAIAASKDCATEAQDLSGFDSACAGHGKSVEVCETLKNAVQQCDFCYPGSS